MSFGIRRCGRPSLAAAQAGVPSVLTAANKGPHVLAGRPRVVAVDIRPEGHPAYPPAAALALHVLRQGQCQLHLNNSIECLGRQ